MYTYTCIFFLKFFKEEKSAGEGDGRNAGVPISMEGLIDIHTHTHRSYALFRCSQRANNTRGNTQPEEDLLYQKRLCLSAVQIE